MKDKLTLPLVTKEGCLALKILNFRDRNELCDELIFPIALPRELH